MIYLYYLSCGAFGIALSAVTNFGIFSWQFWLIEFFWLLTIITYRNIKTK